MPLVKDMMGRSVDVPAEPRHIVSLVPSQTELLADLDLDEAVVGITQFCVHPEKWFRTKARVGGTKRVNLGRVASLKPDLIIANKEENVQEQITALEAFAPVWVSDIKTLADALKMIRSIGAICSRGAAAELIAEEIQQGFAALEIAGTKRKVAYGIWRKPWMWAGCDTFIHDILSRCGFENVLGAEQRYPQKALEALAPLRPELILLSSEPYPFQWKHATEVQESLPDAKALLVDGEMFSWYGSRLLHAPKYLSDLLHSL